MDRTLNNKSKKIRFAKNMNVSVDVIDTIDVEIAKISCLLPPFVGNTSRHYCGRKNSKKDIWVGAFFDEFSPPKICVGFFSSYNDISRNSSNDILLRKRKIDYIAKHYDVDDGYWFYVFLDSPNTKSLASQAEELITTVTKEQQ